MNLNKGTVFIAWHLGLGDAIAFSNMIIELAEHHDRLVVPVWEHNYWAVREIFDDRYDIMIMPFRTHEDYSAHLQRQPEAIAMGNYSPTPSPDGSIDHIHWIYKTTSLNVADRWKIQHIQERVDQGILEVEEVPEPPYIFIHEDARRGFRIDKQRLPNTYSRIQPSNDGISILKWAQVLMHAAEIHVIDSSFFHLTEALNVRTDRVVLHRYARAIPPGFAEYHNTRHPWKILTDATL